MRQQTMRDHLYRVISAQIKSGRYQHGQSLPSIRKMCEIYHVGMRTAQDTLKALKRDGYIQMQERKCAVVCYEAHVSAPVEREIMGLLSHRKATLDVYKSMAALMPTLLSFCAEFISSITLDDLIRPVKRFDNKPYPDRRRILSSVLNGILACAGNPLFIDLYASLEVYSQVPVWQGHEPPCEGELLRNGKNLAVRLECLKRNNTSQVHKQISPIFNCGGREVERYMECLAKGWPNVQEDPAFAYAWNPVKGQAYLYAEVSRDILNKIGDGTYQDGDFLPPAKALASQYGVSLCTVQQALCKLSGFGLVHTINGKGTRVSLKEAGITPACLTDVRYKRDVFTYLYALQFLAVTIRPIALLAFERIDDAVIQKVESELERPGHIPLTALLDAIREALPLQALQVICSQVQKLLLWGNYFIFLQQGDSNANELRAGCLSAILHLEARNAQDFAEVLQHCSIFVLQKMRNFLIRHGVKEAEAVRVPAH